MTQLLKERELFGFRDHELWYEILTRVAAIR